MIELEKALEIINGVPARAAVRTVGLEEALGRVLAAEVLSPIDSPPFDKSAMDGFAVGREDGSALFRIQETVAAGSVPRRALKPGECARIMTGAMLPPGAGRVIRKELVEERDGNIRPIAPERDDNVIRQGASLKAGQPLLGPKVLAPQDIGILAASGIASVQVANSPVTGIVCTGQEIRAPGERLQPGQIYDSNGPQLRAQLAAMRCPSRLYGTVEDAPGPLSAVLAAALAECDVLLLTGGVSEGDFDFVPRCLGELGADILFHGVAVKPGKPTLFARRGERFVFGLPGNPVSTFVIFEVFVKPFLYRRMGIEWVPPSFRGILADPIRRRSTERTEFLPVRLEGKMVSPVAYHGSSHLNALGGADGLVKVDRGVSEIPKGAEVDVRPI